MARLIDIIMCLIFLPIWVPLMLFISIINFLIYKNIFFFQKRRGYRKTIFTIIKFKTMFRPNQKNKNLNFFSRFLRDSKLDEIPQLINLLKGDVTLVGPRPLYPEYDKFLTKKHKNRLAIKPGITGWAQINERPNMKWKDKFDLDVWYVKNKNFFLDLYIIIITFIFIFLSLLGLKKFSNRMNKYKKGTN